MKSTLNDQPNLLNWLGLRKSIDFNRARWLGPILTVLLALFLVAGFSTVIFNFFQASFRVGPYISDTDGSAIRNTGLVAAAFFGLPFIVWRAVVAARQVTIADESLFNDKINDAARALNSRREITSRIRQGGPEIIFREMEDDLVARAAAISRLEDLANERTDSAPRIVRLLATYFRGNFPCNNLEPTVDLELRRIPRMDLQKAIDAIGRVYDLAARVDPSEWRLDLKACNFDGVNFSKGYFRAADFSYGRFEAGIFSQGNFEGCLFFSCLLNHGQFYHSNLRGAKFDYAVINRPMPVSGGIVSSINMGDIKGASFVSSNLPALDDLGSTKEISETFGTADTILSAPLIAQRLSTEDQVIAFRLRKKSERKPLNDKERELVAKLEATGFQNWSPYDKSDLSTNIHRTAFYDNLNMNHWPFWG